MPTDGKQKPLSDVPALFAKYSAKLLRPISSPRSESQYTRNGKEVGLTDFSQCFIHKSSKNAAWIYHVPHKTHYMSLNVWYSIQRRQSCRAPSASACSPCHRFAKQAACHFLSVTPTANPYRNRQTSGASFLIEVVHFYARSPWPNSATNCFGLVVHRSASVSQNMTLPYLNECAL